MNWSDFLIIFIMAGFGISGLVHGFVYSVFRLASFFVSIIVAAKFFPVVADTLMKTALYINIKNYIRKGLLMQQSAQVSAPVGTPGRTSVEAVMNNLKLPDFTKDILTRGISDPDKLLDINRIMDTISGQLARIAIDIISLVALYIAVRIALVFLRFMLQGIAKLPLFKQIDKIGGFALGAMEGLLSIYILCAIVMIFQALPQMKAVFAAIDSSLIAKFFYRNNFIINWMFPGGVHL